jgi:hypothetical protein
VARATDLGFQSSIRRWLLFSTATCLLAPLAIPRIPQDFFSYIMFLPMANFLGVWVAMIVRTWPWRPGGGLDESSKYVRDRYPAIWKRLHPWGDFSYNSITSLMFIAGRYDDGSDPRLNSIKAGSKRMTLFAVWAFVLIPATWLVALPIYISSYPPQN